MPRCAIAYAVEAILESAGGDDRWETRRRLVGLVGLTAAAMALTSAVLVASQPLLTGTFCTLCLTSAALSFVIAGLVFEEVHAAVGAYRFAGPRGG